MKALKNLIRWAKITGAGNDAKNRLPIQQVTYLEKIADTLVVNPYGLHGNVPPDLESRALMFAVGGNPEDRAVIGWTPETRPELQSGEVAFYHPPTDAFIIWKANGDLDIETGDGGKADININCKNVNLTASDDITVTCKNADITAVEDVDVTCNNATVNATLDASVNCATSTVTCVTSLALIAPITTVNATTSITFTTPLATFTGNVAMAGLAASGAATFTSTITNNGKDIGENHTHPQGVDSAGDTQVNTGGVV